MSNEHYENQIKVIIDELNTLQLSYDTRLLAAIMAGRAGQLHGILVNAGHLTQEEARAVWKQAGEPIENPPEKEVKTMSLLDGEIFDPSKTN